MCPSIGLGEMNCPSRWASSVKCFRSRIVPTTARSTRTPRIPAARFAPIEPLRPPAGAPNVLVVLIDDAGFGCASAFGGPCHTPTAERLAG